MGGSPVKMFTGTRAGSAHTIVRAHAAEEMSAKCRVSLFKFHFTVCILKYRRNIKDLFLRAISNGPQPRMTNLYHSGNNF